MTVDTQQGASGPANGVESTAGAASSPSTPSRHGRARHARTNASLTSSSGITSTDAPFSMDALPRRTSVPNDATRIFQTTGLDPFGTEPDTLFRSLPAKEVEAYERAVRSIAVTKQQELRALVGQRYQDLLGTANTIIDMVRSSQQLTERLEHLSNGFQLAADTKEKRDTPSKLARRKSFLPTQHPTGLKDTEASDLHQEAVYVLGASLRLIMDVPEYVWKSIEKGKTLQASWAFLLAKAAWNDLTDASSRHRSQSALLPDAEMGIASVPEAVAMLKVNVRDTFPFIEKQWQSMQPMRKQIIHRALLLLSDIDIESAAVADQLAALVLIDGTRLEQALQLLLSHRLTAMRRLLQRRRKGKKSSSHNKDDRRAVAASTRSTDASESDLAGDRVAKASHTITELTTLFVRSLQHVFQLSVLPLRSDDSSEAKPWLLSLLNAITDTDHSAPAAKLVSSPTSERASLMPQSADDRTPRQNAAAMRALRRKSSHGLPPSSTDPRLDSDEGIDLPQPPQPRAVRVSTADVIQTLPSSRVLVRLLPMSLQEYVPPLDLASRGMPTPSQVMDDVSSWSAKAREIIVGASNHAGTDSLPSLLAELSDVHELAKVRRSLRLAMQRARRIVSRKLGAGDETEDKIRQSALAKVHTEMQNFEADIASALQARLLQLLQQKLSGAAQALLKEAKATITSLERDAASLGNGADAGAAAVEMPLDALFHPVEAQNASSIRSAPLDADNPSNPIRSSRSYISALQDDLRGRSNKVESLASLYETPLSAMSRELKIYRAELEGDERFADASAAIQASFDSLIASSRSDIETGLSDLLDRSDGIAIGAEDGLPRATSLTMQLIAVLATAHAQQDQSASRALRPPVTKMLERHWRPRLERSIPGVFTRPSGTGERTVSAGSSFSTSMLQILALLSESIVELGPALAGPELAGLVRQILEGVATSRAAVSTAADHQAAADAASLTSLLQCEPGALAELIGADTRLHRVRLALSPLLLALAASAPASQLEAASVQSVVVLARADPASAIGDVKPILSVPRNRKLERFSPLPVR
ncbi:hypothetical protein PaG_02475 [Moesziomyces aphidis]|uniref:Conserved oligomeric Golgi complex subunit 1 n=1 Tax=Moesziomyces aphidis TaxID=84754 RepID=W3VPR4_MOEAP|nr:hypothetical protein PaG_02475 [Moesziomyces aphidis]